MNGPAMFRLRLLSAVRLVGTEFLSGSEIACDCNTASELIRDGCGRLVNPDDWPRLLRCYPVADRPAALLTR